MVRGLGLCFVVLFGMWVIVSPAATRLVFPLGSDQAVIPAKSELAGARRAVGQAVTETVDRTAAQTATEAASERPVETLTVSVVPRQLTAAGCAERAPALWEQIAGSPTDFVTALYCIVLGRLPEPEGLSYWAGQRRNGLSPVQIMTQLTESAEYQLKGVRSFRSSLNELRPSVSRRSERTERAAAAQQAQQPPAPTPVSPPTASVDTGQGLRVRAAISDTQFDEFVTGHGLSDIDYVTPNLAHGRRNTSGQRVNVAYVQLSDTRGVSVSPGNRRRATVGTWATEIGAHVAVNGNWYSPYDGPAVSNSVVYGGPDHFYTALFGFTAEGDAIIEHHREVNDGVDPRVVEGVSGHPTLIYRGEPTLDFGTDPTFLSRNPRTAIGLDRSGDVLILVTVDGRSSVARGMTGAETVDLMVSLGAYDAVMLDGGGSSTMWLAGRGVVNNPSGALRSVGNQIAAFGD